MFNVGDLYKTKNGSEVRCERTSNKGHYRMTVLSGGHGVRSMAGEKSGELYWVTSTGEYVQDVYHDHDIAMKLHGMDISVERPTLTLRFETEAQKEAFLAWFLDAGGDQDMSRFSSENEPNCPDYAFYDKETHTITLSKVDK